METKVNVTLELSDNDVAAILAEYFKVLPTDIIFSAGLSGGNYRDDGYPIFTGAKISKTTSVDILSKI